MNSMFWIALIEPWVKLFPLYLPPYPPSVWMHCFIEAIFTWVEHSSMQTIVQWLDITDGIKRYWLDLGSHISLLCIFIQNDCYLEVYLYTFSHFCNLLKTTLTASTLMPHQSKCSIWFCALPLSQIRMFFSIPRKSDVSFIILVQISLWKTPFTL